MPPPPTPILPHIGLRLRSCVPQYSSEAMVEIHRSKLYFARARALRLVPSFRQLPADGPMRLVLVQAGKALQKRAQETGSGRCGTAAAIVGAILAKGFVARREYYSRVWTLAERMARYGRNEGLFELLSLEAWLGMAVDAMLDGVGIGRDGEAGAAARAAAAAEVYRRMLGEKAASMLDSVLEPLAAAARVGGVRTPACEGLNTKVSELLSEAVGVWLAPRLATEAPTKAWLQSYLAEEGLGLYQAWRQGDRVWAVYSYFCWKQNLDQRSADALRIALEDLVEIAAGERGAEGLAGMFAHLGLAAPKTAAPAAAAAGTAAAGTAGDVTVRMRERERVLCLRQWYPQGSGSDFADAPIARPESGDSEQLPYRTSYKLA
jgi:hypothetical protein